MGPRLCQGGGIWARRGHSRLAQVSPSPGAVLVEQDGTSLPAKHTPAPPPTCQQSLSQMCQKGEKPFRAPSEEQTPKN